MPNTPRSYHDVKLLAGDVPDPVPVESVYRVIKSADGNCRRDLEIEALRRSLNAERAARRKLAYELASMRIGIVYPCALIAILALAAVVANAH